MFVFGTQGKFYSDLNEIPESERNLVRIFSVVYDSTVIPSPEIITYMNDQWVSIYASESSVLNHVLNYRNDIDLKKLLYYKGRVFYSKKVLFEYMIKTGRVEIIDITPNSLESKKYPVPPSDHSSLYQEEKERLDQELDDYHKSNGCNC